MYDWEIKQFLECRNYFLNSLEELDFIIKTSPEVKIVKLVEMQKEKSKYYFELYNKDNYYIWIKNKGNT